MVDVLKALNFEYVAANRARASAAFTNRSSLRQQHGAGVHHVLPRGIVCRDGTRLLEGRRQADAVLVHGTVGLQHASMAIYNAYCDRVPIVIMAGNSLDATMRRPGVEWAHSVQDAAAMVRDYIKWDDLPWSLPHYAESAVRGYKIAMTPR